MTRLFFVLLTINAMLPAWGNGTISSEFNLISYYQPIAIREFFGEWAPPPTFKGGNRAFHFASYEIGYYDHLWGITLFAKDTAEMRFTPDTAELYMLTDNKLKLPNRIFHIDLKYNRATYFGVRIDRNFKPLPRFSLNVGLSFIGGESLTSGQLWGNINPSQTGTDFDLGQAYINYYYSKDDLFDHTVDRPHGAGLGIDTKLHWRSPTRWEISSVINNLLAGIYWFNTPHTQAQIISNNKEIINGYVKINPILSGRHTSQGFWQKLPLVADNHISMQAWGPFHWENRVFYSDIFSFISTGAGLHLSDDHRIKILYTSKTQSLDLQWKSKWCGLSLQSDSGSVNDIRQFGINFFVKLEL